MRAAHREGSGWGKNSPGVGGGLGVRPAAIIQNQSFERLLMKNKFILTF